MRKHRLICFRRIKASLLNYDTEVTSGFDVEQHERLQNTDRVLGTGHYVRRGGREKKGGRAGKGYFRLAREGGGLNFFIKKFRGGPQFDRKVYFKRGSLAKMGKAGKQ